jgi:hypothetical protein
MGEQYAGNVGTLDTSAETADRDLTWASITKTGENFV